MAAGKRKNGEPYSHYRARLNGEETRTRQVVMNGSPRIQLFVMEMERQRRRKRDFKRLCIIGLIIWCIIGVVWFFIR